MIKKLIKTLSSSLGNIDIKIIDGSPHWKERGADTFVPFSGSGIDFYIETVSTSVTSVYTVFNVPCPKNAKKVTFSIDNAIVQANVEIRFIVNNNIVYKIPTTSGQGTSNIIEEFDFTSNDGIIQINITNISGSTVNIWAKIDGLTIKFN